MATGDKVKGKGKELEEEKRGTRKETIEAIVIALLLALIIRTFFVQAFKIPSSSMEETLLIGDHILVSKVSYGLQVPKPAIIKVLGIPLPFFKTDLSPKWGEIERGDVVVFRPPHEPEKDYIKRVVGLPGDVISIVNQRIFIDGVPMDDPYSVFKGSRSSNPLADNFAPFKIPEGTYFVMGDNRNNSYDSRFWGPVSISEIKGKAFILYWSWDKVEGGVRFGRIGDLIR